jgi:hypothetical protein
MMTYAQSCATRGRINMAIERQVFQMIFEIPAIRENSKLSTLDTPM